MTRDARPAQPTQRVAADAGEERVDEALETLDSMDAAAGNAPALHPHAPAAAAHGRHRPVRVAMGAYAVRWQGGAVRRTSRTLDYRHMDGNGMAVSADNRDYVLTPISAAAESEAGADYVMGTVSTAGRLTDPEVARGW